MAMNRVDTKFSNSNIVALTQQNALKKQLENTAQNLANINTTAAKSMRLIFSQAILKSPNGREVSFVEEKGAIRDLTPGVLEQTGHDFDVALEVPGYLSVQTPEGVKYTRNGNFHVDGQTSQLVNAAGYPVLNKDGAPITIPAGSSPVHIDPSGRIIGARGALGAFQISNFENEQALIPRSAGLYETSQVPIPVLNVSIRQGSLEASNINGVIEATKLIDISRSYEQIQASLQKSDERSKGVIEKVGRV